jgi:D-threo-aldose 1-dehydrogenase
VDVAAAPRQIGASSEQQILAEDTSKQTKIPVEYWTELKAQKFIEQNVPIPA